MTTINLSKMINAAAKDQIQVHGTTAMIHKVRVILGLTMEEYAMADLIQVCQDSNLVFDFGRVYRRIGIEDEEHIKELVKNLLKKKIIEKKDDKFIMAKRWNDEMRNNLDDNFEKFWIPAKNKIWGGSKPLAKKYYSELLGKVDQDYLLQQKLDYFEFLNLPENSFRNTLQASEFLNPQFERYAENWKEQAMEIIHRRNPEVKRNIDHRELTEEEQRRMFQ